MEKPGIEHTTPGLKGDSFTSAPCGFCNNFLNSELRHKQAYVINGQLKVLNITKYVVGKNTQLHQDAYQTTNFGRIIFIMCHYCLHSIGQIFLIWFEQFLYGIHNISHDRIGKQVVWLIDNSLPLKLLYFLFENSF